MNREPPREWPDTPRLKKHNAVPRTRGNKKGRVVAKRNTKEKVEKEKENSRITNEKTIEGDPARLEAENLHRKPLEQTEGRTTSHRRRQQPACQEVVRLSWWVELITLVL
jgi:hypothetical protein